MKLSSVKIFGERNTSTNALGILIKRNFKEIKIWPSKASELEPNITKKLRLIGHQEGGKKKENEIDKVFSDVPPLLSWKHSATCFNDLESFSDVKIIVMVRHPASWLLALHKRPYHALQHVEHDFEKFLLQPWKTTKRDLLGERTVTPIELWNLKTKSYLDFIDKAGKTIDIEIFKFEDFAISQEETLKRLSQSLKGRQGEVSVVEKSTKDTKKDAEWYSDYYGNERWRENLSKASNSIINESVDTDIMNRLSYNLI